MINISQLNFEIGAFVRNGNNGYAQVAKNNPYLHLSLKIEPICPQEIILQISIENRGDDQALNSLFVDFELPDFIAEEVLENAWTQSGFSGYKPGIHPSRKRKLFLLRDQNPCSFLPEYGYIKNAQISEWYTQILGTHQALLIGAVTTGKQFTSIYILKQGKGTYVRVACQLDGIILNSGEICQSERVYLGVGDRDALLEIFALLLKSNATIETLPEPVKGLCCSYYFQGNKVDESYIKQELLAIDRLPCTVGLELIQIDAGYATWGDWLDTSRRFPSGMKSIVSEINKRGLKAGIWIAPFVVSPHSKLFQEHPDWFVKDAQGRYVPARLTCPFDFLPKLVIRVLDITKPAVQIYIAEVINQFVEWGFEYIKTDFTYPICFSTNYELPMTRAQALRLGFEIINKASRGQAHIQSCISQLSPLVGLVDYARTGADTINPYVCFLPFIRKQVNALLLSSNLQNCEARQFLNGKVWINDADCLVCRPKTGLSTELIDRQFKFITNYHGSIWVGDNLINLRWNKYEKYLLELFGYQPRKKTAISVVVPAWNEEKTIQKTLDSLSRQQTKMPFEVILVDNNCTDNTVNVANTFQDRINHLRVVRETTQGIGAARNTGFDFASSDLIASTDADTNVPENWISEIFERFWGNENLAAIVGTFVFYSKGRFYNLVARSVEIAGDSIHKLIVGSFAFRGTNFAIRKSFWEKAGGFNTQISALEDVDLSLRVGEIGEITYAPTLTVSTSFRRFEGRFMRQLIKRSQAYFYRVIRRNTAKHTDWEPIR